MNLMDPAHQHAYDLLRQACRDGTLFDDRHGGLNRRDALWLLREKGLMQRNGKSGRKKGWVPTDEGWKCSMIERPEERGI